MTKIAQGWPKLWAYIRALIGILRHSVGPSLAIWANPVQFSFQHDVGLCTIRSRHLSASPALACARTRALHLGLLRLLRRLRRRLRRLLRQRKFAKLRRLAFRRAAFRRRRGLRRWRGLRSSGPPVILGRLALAWARRGRAGRRRLPCPPSCPKPTACPLVGPCCGAVPAATAATAAMVAGPYACAPRWAAGRAPWAAAVAPLQPAALPGPG